MDSSEESPNVEGLKLFEGQAQYLPEGLKYLIWAGNN